MLPGLSRKLVCSLSRLDPELQATLHGLAKTLCQQVTEVTAGFCLAAVSGCLRLQVEMEPIPGMDSTLWPCLMYKEPIAHAEHRRNVFNKSRGSSQLPLAQGLLIGSSSNIIDRLWQPSRQSGRRLTSKAMMLVFLVWARAILIAFSTTSEPLLAKMCVSSPLGTILPSLSSSPTCK